MKKNIDHRVVVTEKWIKKAFIDLLMVKPIYCIKVKEVCENAGINRGTFYLHYKDIYDLLDKLGVAYERVDHEAAMTMEICQEIDKVLQATICKNLFLCNRQETKFYLLMIPDTKVFHTKDLSAQINSSRLSFAKPEYMEKFLDITPGSVSVLGLMNDTENHVQLLIDEDVLKGEFIGCHPCINTSSIRFHTSDLVEKVLPAVNHEFIKVKL